MNLMQLLRKFKLFTSLFLLTVFIAFSGFQLQGSLSEQYRRIGDKIEINQIICAYSSEYLTSPTLDRVNFQVLSIIKTFFENTSPSNVSQPIVKYSHHLNANGLYTAERSISLEKICKLQI
jgi:hypothetical protein